MQSLLPYTLSTPFGNADVMLCSLRMYYQPFWDRRKYEYLQEQLFHVGNAIVLKLQMNFYLNIRI